MSWFSRWFRSDSFKAILKLGEKLLKIVVGNVAGDLQRIAKQEVLNAEASGRDGLDKYEMAFKGVRSRYPEIKESFINHAIETAVLALNAARNN